MEHLERNGNHGVCQPLSELTHRMLEAIHQEIAAELPRLRDLSARLLQRHGDAYQAIAAPLITLIEDLRAAIEHRYLEEADELFPLVDALVRGAAPDDAAERLCGMRCRLELSSWQSRRCWTACDR